MKILILLASLLLTDFALACRCDFSGVANLSKNPASAQTAFIGQLDLNQKKPTLRIERAWTEYEPSLTLDSGGTCAQEFKPNHHYLVLSFNNIHFIKKRGIGVTICDSVVVELSDAKDLIQKLVVFPVKSDFSSNPSWHFCKDDKDCIPVTSPCEGTEAVNKQFKESYEKWSRDVAPRMNCVRKTNAVRSIKCESNLCSAK